MSPSSISFLFKDGSKWLKGGKGFYAALAIYGVPNGVGKVEQLVGKTWTMTECAPSFGPHRLQVNIWSAWFKSTTGSIFRVHGQAIWPIKEC
jgi:hypothetical protein